MSSLAEEFPKEQARVRTILSYYKEVGPAGSFGAIMIEETLRHADFAAMSGDVVEMIQAYKAMQEIE